MAALCLQSSFRCFIHNWKGTACTDGCIHFACALVLPVVSVQVHGGVLSYFTFRTHLPWCYITSGWVEFPILSLRKVSQVDLKGVNKAGVSFSSASQILNMLKLGLVGLKSTNCASCSRSLECKLSDFSFSSCQDLKECKNGLHASHQQLIFTIFQLYFDLQNKKEPVWMIYAPCSDCLPFTVAHSESSQNLDQTIQNGIIKGSLKNGCVDLLEGCIDPFSSRQPWTALRLAIFHSVHSNNSATAAPLEQHSSTSAGSGWDNML